MIEKWLDLFLAFSLFVFFVWLWSIISASKSSTRCPQIYEGLFCVSFANRIGNVGKLMVQKLSAETPGQVATAVSYPSHSRLDLNPAMDLFIAGLPQGYKVRRTI